MPWLSLIPWRLVAAFALLASVALGIHHYGELRYEAGKEEVQHIVELKVAQANQEARAAEQSHQEHINAISIEHQQQLDTTRTHLAAAVAAGDGLRRALYSFGPVQPSKDTKATSRPDGAAEVFRELLGACSSLAEQRAGEAEALADQLRGLQSYANEVSQ